MNFWSKAGYKEAIIIAGLGTWASITLVFMIARSWAAGNSRWVSIFAGLICLAAALAINAFRTVYLREECEGNVQ
ncbi:MAG: hypothetical protein WDA53_00875 [Bacillota bacterium]